VSAPEPVPTWIENLPQRPLCDVPWLGRAVVLSTGDVNFCCSSDAFVGNVHHEPLAAIWRGNTMRRIRRTLAAQQFPPECRSNACPIYRGDASTYLLQRMDGVATPTQAARRASVRAALRDTQLLVAPRLARGDRLQIQLTLPDGMWAEADLFVALTGPGGELRFLPELVDYPLPARRRFAIPAAAQTVEVADIGVAELLAGAGAGPAAIGAWTCCVGLFVVDANPTAMANCYWHARTTFELV